MKLGVLVIVAITVAWMLLAWLRSRRVALATTPISAEDPLMLEAFRKARASIDVLRAHAGGAQQAGVKFPVRNAAQEIEHVWGELESVEEEHLVARVVTPLIEGPTPTEPMVVPLAELEDWQMFLDDGSIRGGFTTQAQIAIARREGHPIPKNVLTQEGRFVDK
jgi:uncharacterized protein YegJ (DUF2314 family)